MNAKPEVRLAFTPGPWSVVRKPKGATHLHLVCASNGFVLAEVGHPDIDTTPANARLISQAPALLDALRDLLNVVAPGELEPEYVEPFFREPVMRARAAIRQAEGSAEK